MIASVAGPVLSVGLDHIVVETGGVGLYVHTTPATAAEFRTGGDARLATTLVVREESLTLFGFSSPDHRALFEQLQTVSGVGPRLALAVLAVHDPDGVRRAILDKDLTALTKVPGIGRKSAERLVLELRDKITPPAGDPAATDAGAPAGGGADGAKEQVHEALIGLGWNAKQADDALARLAKREDTPADVAGLLRAALRELGR